MHLERHQHVVHRARAIGYRHNQAHAVPAAGSWRALHMRQADHGKPRPVEGVVLYCMGRDVQAEFCCGAITRDAGPGRVGRRQACAFGIARGGTPLGLGKMGVQPTLALRQCLWMGINHLDAVQRRRLAQQVVAYQQAGFTYHVQRRVQEQVE